MALGETGRQLVRGEHAAITLINDLIPGMAPKALAWGKYSFTPPETFFFIEDFRDMDLGLPDPRRLAQRLVQLHSQVSPNGKFGFHVPTFDGIAPHPDGWETSWRVSFTRLLRKSVETEYAAHGVCPELSKAVEQLLAAVVPKLLDPLQEGLDPIRPRLIHGDCWGGNMGQDKETGELIFFDAGCFYAHSEMELGMWQRGGPLNLGQVYLDEYTRMFPPSEPQGDFDDRNRLYSLKFDLNTSAAIPGLEARHM